MYQSSFHTKIIIFIKTHHIESFARTVGTPLNMPIHSTNNATFVSLGQITQNVLC